METLIVSQLTAECLQKNPKITPVWHSQVSPYCDIESGLKLDASWLVALCKRSVTEPPSVLRESPKYVSCHSDSSVRLCLSVSWLAWELRMVGVEGQVFPVFLFFFFLF